MANVLSLALKINADASGVNLTPVERALKRLGDETDKVTGIFDKFAGSSEAAVRAQDSTRKSLEDLIAARQAGTVTAAEFAEQFRNISEAAREEAAALQQAARITEQNLTAVERFTGEQAELKAQLDAGRISTETYDRAVERAAKGLTDAERATAGLKARQDQLAGSTGQSTLKFNELSGVFAAIPGPLGNIAGRLSGLSSAGEGLSRIFAGGLSQGITGLVGSFTALINPLTLGLAGLAAFAAAATKITQGLIQLEDRVERLGNQAAQLGVSFEFVQILEEAARRSGVSVGSLEGAITRLQRTLAGAGEESKKATKSLAGLGISVEEIQSLNPQQQFELIGQRIAAIEDPAKRTAAAVELFGKSGAGLLPFFRNLPGAANDIERFGRAITDLEQQQIDGFGAALDQLSVAFQGLGQAVLIPFVETGTGVAENLTIIISGVTRTIEALSGVLGPLISLLGGALNGALGIVAEAFRGIAVTAEAARSVFLFFFPQGTAAAEQTAAAVAQVREQVERPLANNIISEIARATEESTRLFQQATADIRQYGNDAGVAFIRLRAAINAARQAFDQSTPEGAEQFARAVELANDNYERQIDLLRKASDARQQQVKAEQDIVEKLLDQQRIQRDFGGDSRRATAADNARAVEAEIVRLQSRLQDVIGSSAEDEVRARIRALRQVQQVEVDIASGRTAARIKELEDEKNRITAFEQERERIQKESAQRVAQERQKVNDFVNEQLALAQFGGDSQRLQAARNLKDIEQEIARVNAEGAAARARGDQAGVDAALKRIAQLDQVAAKEEEIASGRKAAEEELAKKRDEAVKLQEKTFAESAKAQEQQAAQVQKSQQQQAAQAEKALAEQAKRNEERLKKSRQLATASTEAAQGADIRTEAGARNFIQAIQGGFDPQLAVQRQQLNVQREIATGLQANLRALGFQTFRFPAAAGA